MLRVLESSKSMSVASRFLITSPTYQAAKVAWLAWVFPPAQQPSPTRTPTQY